MTGLLLINLGSPDKPDIPSIRRYLRQFLSDPFVVNMNPIARWLLAFYVSRTRAPQSAAAYKKIWTGKGSPLLIHTEELCRKVSKKLGGNYVVKMAMRYGNPSIKSALESLVSRGVSRILVLPLYPQYAQATTVSSVNEVHWAAHKIKLSIPTEFLPSFCDHPSFIRAFAERGRKQLSRLTLDHILFSFHGLPETQIKRIDASGCCLVQPTCCDQFTDINKDCYRAQCFQTAILIAKKLGLKKENYTVSFQSRMGQVRWIEPYTDCELISLARKGKKRVAVFCPSFVADCLETLEEIGIRGRQLFTKNGGEIFEMVSSLNDDPLWVEAVCGMVVKNK